MSANISLSQDGLVYSVDYGLLERIRHGKAKVNGFAPLEHINAVEITRIRVLPFYVALVGLAFLGAAGYTGFIEGYRYYDARALLFGAIGLTLILAWLFITASFIVFYSEGTPIVAASLSDSQAGNLLRHYTELKSSKGLPGNSQSQSTLGAKLGKL